MASIGRQMAKGAGWMLLGRFLDRTIGLVSMIILARLLFPEDFGLVAMAMALVAVLEILTTFSLDIPLIQNRNATKSHYDTAWTFNVCFGAGTALILLILAVPLTRFYEEPRLVPVVAVLAAGTVVQGFENIGIVAFRKELQFGKEFAFTLSTKLAGFVVVVPMALVFRNYWALVSGMLAGRICGVFLSYRMHPYRPAFSVAATKDLFHFSKWLLVNNIIYFVNNKSADFIIGKVAGSRALGLYTVGSELAQLPTTHLVAPINRAVFPGYAKTRGLDELRAGYLDVISIIILLAIPAAVGIAVTAPLIVPVVLGQNWLDAIPLIQIMAIYGGIMAAQTNISSVYLALAQPRILTVLGIINSVVLLPTMLILAISYGANGAAWAYLGTAAIVAPINYSFLFRSLKLPLRAFLCILWRPVFASVFMAAMVLMWMAWLESWMHDSARSLQLLSAMFCGAAAYGLCVIVLWLLSSKPPGAERHMLAELARRLGWRVLAH